MKTKKILCGATLFLLTLLMISPICSAATTVYASFPGKGLYSWDGTAWTGLTSDMPESMVASGSTLYGDFGAMGLWKWDGSSWSQLTPDNPESMVVSGSTLYGDFGALGLWKWDGSSWSQLTPDNPESMVASGSMLYADFGTLGLWRWNGSSWSQLTPDNPQNIVASGSMLYGDFGPLGLWRWNGSSWSQLTSDNPENIAASGSTLFGDFGTLGLWKWNGSSWTQLTTDNPQKIAASGSMLYGDFGTLGLWLWNGNSWSQLSSFSPESMVESNSTLYGDFGALGLWLWNGHSWPQLTVDNPAIVTVPTYPIVLTSFVTGFVIPVGLEIPEDGSGRLFVIELGGTIRIIQNATLLPTPFLDVTPLIESGGEKGLLGLAFHPNFSANRRFFINYTRRVGLQLQSVISEFSASVTDPNLADVTSQRQLLIVNQPFDNHNGGQLAFGPDGFLYIAFGDGGSANDSLGNGQSLLAFLGKILRIDVDGTFSPGKQYAIPADNPFALGGGLPEIWAYGLRNPWRFSFDHATGRLFAGDVGQANFEEVDLIVKGGNFGWNIMEGDHCYPPGSSCNTAGLILPITEYAHDASGGFAVIGGFVYRGALIPGVVGHYIFGDLASGHLWGLQEVNPGVWQQTLLLTHNLTVSAFGQDSTGELYLVDYGSGAVLNILAVP